MFELEYDKIHRRKGSSGAGKCTKDMWSLRRSGSERRRRYQEQRVQEAACRKHGETRTRRSKRAVWEILVFVLAAQGCTELFQMNCIWIWTSYSSFGGKMDWGMGGRRSPYAAISVGLICCTCCHNNKQNPIYSILRVSLCSGNYFLNFSYQRK